MYVRMWFITLVYVFPILYILLMLMYTVHENHCKVMDMINTKKIKIKYFSHYFGIYVVN